MRTVDEYKGTVLVVDDDPDILRVLSDRLNLLGFRVTCVNDGKQALEAFARELPDLVFLDLQMPVMDGMEVLRKLRDYPPTLTIVMTAFATIERAVLAMKEGAADFITKPFSFDHIAMVVNKLLEAVALEKEVCDLKEAVRAPYREILGENGRLCDLISSAKRVAQTDSTVLLLGESGTGKELFARSIHGWSVRVNRPFIVVNCLALNTELLESELFGHERGAFTGAHQIKKGKFEVANGGTVFLDEIGDINPVLQGKLLRVLQERECERVGSNVPIRLNIRVIAATNKDLHKEVLLGKFREDLFFRLNVISFVLPPLRDRVADIPLLAEYLLSRSCKTVKRGGMQFSPIAIDHLKQYDWPGNVRELGNVIERAVVLAKGDTIYPSDLILLPLHQREEDEIGQRSYTELTRVFQKRMLESALQRTEGNQTKASSLLGLQRTYFSRLMKNLQVKV